MSSCVAQILVEDHSILLRELRGRDVDINFKVAFKDKKLYFILYVFRGIVLGLCYRII